MKRAALVLALGLASGCELYPAPVAPRSLGAPPARAPQTPPVTQAIPLSATTEARFNPEGAQSVSDLRSVTIHADVTGAEGPVGIQAQLIAPSGERYVLLEETLFGRPWETQPVDFELPVRGTFVDQRSLAGTWTARLTVAGTVVATQTFELSP